MTTAFTVYKNLIKQGFEHLGSGYYSAVFASKDDPNIVYKLGTNLEDPCLVYLQQAYNNIHFPKIYSLYVGDNYYLAKMEHLDTLPAEKWRVAEELSDAVIYETTIPDAELNELVCNIQKLRDSNSSFIVDIHPSNVMLRNNLIPVITDPFSEEISGETVNLETWESKYYNSVYSDL
jgi:hypothetical protein